MLAGVLLHGVQPPRPVQTARNGLPHGQRGIGEVGHGFAVGAHVQHLGAAQRAEVTGLAAPLREKRRAIQNDGERLTLRGAAQDGGGEFLHISVSFV